MVMAACGSIMIVFAEQLCVKREMQEGLQIDSSLRHQDGHVAEELDDVELGERARRVD